MRKLHDSKQYNNQNKDTKKKMKLELQITRDLAILITISATFIFILNFSSIQINICNGFLGGICNIFNPTVVGVPTLKPQPTPTSQPTTIPTVTPNPNECTRFGPYTSETDKVRVTVKSVLIQKINNDIDRLSLMITVENLTNAVINLDLYDNTQVLDASNDEIINAPDMRKSIWEGEVAANSKEDWIIALDRISVYVPYITFKFLDLSVNGKFEPANLFIENIRSSCSSDN